MPKTQKPRRERRSAKRTIRFPKGPNGGLELLLVQSVEHLGNQGDIVEVKPGYAYNYLIPQGLATVASDHHKRMIEKHRSKLLEIQKTRLAGYKALASRLTQQNISIEANANEEGHLYGSVGGVEIAEALAKVGFEIQPEQIKLTGLIKELGLYTVQVRLGRDPEGKAIEADLKFWVVPAVSEEPVEG